MKHTRIVGSAGVLIILILALIGCTTPPAELPDETGEIRIGVLLPLSGRLAEYGQASENAIMMRLQQINDSGGIRGRTIAVFVQDTEGDADRSKRMAERLIQSNGVQAILGPLSTGGSIGAGQVCQSLGVPMISIAATLPGVTEVGEYVFRTAITEDYQAYIIAKFAVESLGSTRASSIAFSDDPRGQQITAAFRRHLNELSGAQAQVEIFEADSAAWDSSIEGIVAFRPDVLFVPSALERVEQILPVLRDRGIDAVALGSYMWLTMDPNRSVFDGSYFVDHHSPNTYEQRSKDFVEAYERSYGPIRNSIPALAHEAVIILAEAFRTANSPDPAAIRNALANTDTETLMGRFRFDETGDPIKPAIIRQVKSGEIQYVVSIYPEVVSEQEFRDRIVPAVRADRTALPVISILDLKLSNIAEADAAILADLIGSAMTNTDAFRVLERGQRDKMLEELEFSYSDMADEQTQIRIGKQLAADRIITGSLGKLADRFILNLKMIDVERGETVSASYQVYESMNALVDSTDRLVIDLVSKTVF